MLRCVVRESVSAGPSLTLDVFGGYKSSEEFNAFTLCSLRHASDLSWIFTYMYSRRGRLEAMVVMVIDHALYVMILGVVGKKDRIFRGYG